jgi:hypothetical protein
VCEHQRDRLRVLVLHVRQQLARVGVAEEVERHVGHRRLQPVQDQRGAFGAQGCLQQLAGVLQAADAGVLGGRHGVELVDHVADDVGFQLAQPGDLGGQLLDLVLGQAGQHPGRVLLAHPDQQDRGLAQTRQRGRAQRGGAHVFLLSQGDGSAGGEPAAEQGGHFLGLLLDHLLDLALTLLAGLVLAVERLDRG